MKLGLYLIFFIHLTFLSVYAQTKVTLQNNISNNMIQFEYNFLDGKTYSKRLGEIWSLEKQKNDLTIVGTNEKTMITEVTYLDGTTYYTFDNQIWHPKSFIVNDTTISEHISAILHENYQESSNSLEIECMSEGEQQVHFYLMPMIGGTRILIGSSVVNQGVNKLLFNVDMVKKGNFFLIMDQNLITLISKIIIF